MLRNNLCVPLCPLRFTIPSRHTRVPQSYALCYKVRFKTSRKGKQLKMNRIVLAVFAISLLGLTAIAQEKEKKITAKEVPALVIENFNRAYPKAIIRGYASEMEGGKQYYEIESREGTTRRDVLYNPDGTVAEIEESIDPNKLPSAALQAIKQKYPRAVITLAERTTVGDKVTYEVSAREGRKRFTMEFDSDGKVIQKNK